MNDELKLCPKVQEIQVEQEWVDPHDKGRWAKLVTVYLEDSLHKVGLFKNKNREIGELFYLIVCSPSFSVNPDIEWQDEEMDKALIQNDYSQEDVYKYVVDAVNKIGPVTIEELDKSLRKLFDMSDWDQVDEVLPTTDR